MPGYELLGSEELAAIKLIFDGAPVLFAHGHDKTRSNFHIREFEKCLANKFSSDYVLCVSSGTAAIKIALKALGIGPGDEVITQGFNFIGTVEAITDIGALPVITNIDDSLNMCTDSLRQKISHKTKAILPVHMLGVPADLENIMKVSAETNIPVIEDACEAIGAKYASNYVGTIGHLGVYSFDFGKNITTGEGGAILTSTGSFDQFMRSYHDHGHANRVGVPRGLDEIACAGFNYRMTEISGAIGKVQLEKLDHIIALHKERYNILENGVNKKFRQRTVPAFATPSYDCYVFEVNDEKAREVIIHILHQLGVGTKNLPDAMVWHCAFFWEHLTRPEDREDLVEVKEKLKNCIAVPINIKVPIKKYEEFVAAIIKL